MYIHKYIVTTKKGKYIYTVDYNYIYIYVYIYMYILYK